MSLVEGLLRFIGFPGLKKKPELSRSTVLRARPLRNPSARWETEEGETIITIPLKPKGKGAKLLSRWFPVSEEKQIALDEIGSEVWALCDGQSTIEQIIKKIGEKYKLNRKEAEASILEYLRQLSRRKLVIAFAEAQEAKALSSSPPQSFKKQEEKRKSRKKHQPER